MPIIDSDHWDEREIFYLKLWILDERVWDLLSLASELGRRRILKLIREFVGVGKEAENTGYGRGRQR